MTRPIGPDGLAAGDLAPAVRVVPGPAPVDREADTSVEATGAATATAFDELFRATYPQLVRALSVAADRGAAADAVQEAFVQADVHWRRVGTLDNPGAWVRRVAINRLANHRRGLRRREAAVARLDAGEASVGLDPADLDLAAALRALPEKQRLAICLHYLADLSVAEVAESLGVAEGTVKSNLHDARRALRDQLGDQTDG
jgi:RNA polymerase sigma-70 factor (ECF subfamily)